MQTFESETVTEKQVDFGILLHDDQLQTLWLVSYKKSILI